MALSDGASVAAVASVEYNIFVFYNTKAFEDVAVVPDRRSYPSPLSNSGKVQVGELHFQSQGRRAAASVLRSETQARLVL